jgi:hypothetical protein
MRVLNIDVAEGLLERWLDWFSPAVQPFVADADLASRVGKQTARHASGHWPERLGTVARRDRRDVDRRA